MILEKLNKFICKLLPKKAVDPYYECYPNHLPRLMKELKMSDAPMCTWCASTEHTLSDCPIAPEPENSIDDIVEGLKMVKRFNKMADGDFCSKELEDE